MLAAAARRHDFGRWAGRTRLPGSLHVRGWSLAPTIAARLRPQRRRVVPAGLRASTAVWSLAGDPEAVVRLDVCEAASGLDADRLLLRMLAGVESPVLARDDAADLGDVAFTLPGGAAVLFSRGNLVFLLARAGRAPLDIVGLGRAVDRDVTSPPPTADPDRRHGLDRDRSGRPVVSLRTESRADGVRRLRLGVSPALADTDSPTVKVFAPRGRLREDPAGGAVLFAPADAAAPARVTVCAYGRVDTDARRCYVAEETL
jgi:hypothetical protein